MAHLVHEKVREPVTGPTVSTSSDLFFRARFVQSFWEAAVSVRICSTGSERL